MTSSAADFAIHLACGSTACCAADALCLPLDMIKVRMQLQNELLPPTATRLGVVAMSSRILKTEGWLAFYDGFAAAMMRQASYGGMSFVLYARARDVINPEGESATAPLWSRIAAGVVAGAASSSLANPIDVVKVRLQADGRLRLQGKAARYRSTLHAFGSIARQEGLGAFYRGVLPNVQRASVVCGVGVSAYDHTKQTVLRAMGETESLSARFLAAMIGGVMTALAGTPFDVAKVRMMNEHQPAADGARTYPSVWRTFASIVRTEGPLALWKGLGPVYTRNAPFTMANYLLMEHLTLKLLGRSM